ncbi:cyclic nucleotide-binding domain-containing protein [Cognatishimia sp. F0-27]|uniref:cyclic nucleotide-binding domain-containing protein n=1 Tax=Cognatishimia sp. F0-27 TaxID=2816855 RepID=UPI001D0CAEF3|nr:cyclic nucleotide-binding domain-containing protein [Cognatishimia sp. F0-27]MCC1491576.1 cyclic nucleotide-binding domain-containing protein [Cognatishimia sp. F0-27]
MGASWISADLLVLIAAGCHALGYLALNQVVLRLFLLAGTGFYVWYYWAAAEAPLWAAINTSLVLGAANLIGLSTLLIGRSMVAVPRAHRDIYAQFHDMPPGDFRALVRCATRLRLTDARKVTTEGVAVSQLYYLIEGRARIEKRGTQFTMPAGIFIGEVAYLTRRASSASTWIEEGSEVLVWDVVALRRHAARRTRFKLALEAMISKDLATKVAFAVAPSDREKAEEEARAMVQYR